MDMTLVTSSPSPADTMVAVFAIVWPFLVLGMLRSRVRSSAPVAAMLAPLALATSAVWSNLISVGMGMSMAGPMPRAESAGIADALSSMVYGAFGAALIAVFTLLRKHVPAVDRVSAAILGVTVLSVAGAVVAGENLRRLALGLCRTGVVVGIVAGAAAIGWSVWQARGERPLRPIAYGIAGAAITVAIVAAVVWERVQHHFDFAAGR